MNKNEIIKEIMPDLIEALSIIIDKKFPTKKTVKKVNKTKTVKKQAEPIQEEPKRRGRPKKATPKTQPKKNKVVKKFVREDFAGENTYVDNLEEAAEFIETDKIICKPHSGFVERDNDLMPNERKCGRTNESGKSICNKTFRAFGKEYLCPDCVNNLRKSK